MAVVCGALVLVCLAAASLNGSFKAEAVAIAQLREQSSAISVASAMRDDLVRGEHASIETATRTTIVTLSIEILAWLAWQWSAHRRLRALGARRPRFGPIVGLATWVIPVADLVLPGLVLRDLLVASDPEDEEQSRRKWWTTALVGGWWLLFLGVAVDAVASTVIRSRDPSSAVAWIERDQSAKPWVWLVVSAALAAAALVIVVTARISRKERRVRSAMQQRAWVGWRS